MSAQAATNRHAEAFAGIPAELRERHQWVIWCYEQRDDTRTKVPYRPDLRGRASSTDPATWGTFSEAVGAAGAADGIGFVLSPDDPYVGIDLDDALSDAARDAILVELDSYTETSVGGRGVHIIVRASLNGHARHRRGPFEVYEAGRYFVMTGAHVHGTPATVEDRQAQLEDVLQRFLPVRTPAHGRPDAAQPIDLDDRDLLDRAKTARNGHDFETLWKGEWKGRYSSASEADLAFCSTLAFWTGRDADRIDRLFRSSGLMREKWNRDDYRARTIDTAIAGTREVFSPRATAKLPIGSPADGPVFTDLRTIAQRDVHWLDRPFLPAGELVTNSGDGDIGKGLLAVHYTALMTRGELGDRRMVLFAVAEDALDTVLKPRLIAAGADLAYVRAVNYRRKGLTDAIRIPDDVARLEEDIARLEARLLLIDPLLSHFSGKTNTYVDHEVKIALQPLVDLAQRTGCTVVGNHHLSKDTSRGARKAAQASNAFINTPRVAWAMAADDDDPDVRVVEVIKSNIGPKNVGRNYRVRAVPVDGLDEPQPILVRESAASKSVDDLLAVMRHGKRIPSELLRALVIRELEAGEKPRKHLDEIAKHETGANADSVYKSALGPLKNEGTIAARKDGPDGGWYWRLTPGSVA